DHSYFAPGFLESAIRLGDESLVNHLISEVAESFAHLPSKPIVLQQLLRLVRSIPMTKSSEHLVPLIRNMLTKIVSNPDSDLLLPSASLALFVGDTEGVRRLLIQADVQANAGKK